MIVSEKMARELDGGYGVQIARVVKRIATCEGELIIFHAKAEGGEDEDPMTLLFLGETIIDCGYE